MMTKADHAQGISKRGFKRLAAWVYSATAGLAVWLAVAPAQAQYYGFSGTYASTGVEVVISSSSAYNVVQLEYLLAETRPAIGQAGVAIGSMDGSDITLNFFGINATNGISYGTYTVGAPAIVLHAGGVSGAAAPGSINDPNGDGGTSGGNITLNTANGTLTSSGAPVIQALDRAGNGGQGSSGVIGGNGGNGGTGGVVTIDNNASLTGSGSINPPNRPLTSNRYSAGMIVQSTGGDGGNAGNSSSGNGGIGGSGGDGGAVMIQNHATITVSGSVEDTISPVTPENVSLYTSGGISALSAGGYGGDGGTGVYGGNGGAGGRGGVVTVQNSANITISGGFVPRINALDGYEYGFGSSGIFALSLGGDGGYGGDSTASGRHASAGGVGANGGDGDSVTVENRADISVTQSADPAIRPMVPYSYNPEGIFALSKGGTGGDGGYGSDSARINSDGGNGGDGGYGGSVNVLNSGTIETAGNNSSAILAESLGGRGGAGGTSGSRGNGGIGGNGGDGSDAMAINVGGTLTTLGIHSLGILVQSMGGNGGDGGTGLRGNGGTGGYGGYALANNGYAYTYEPAISSLTSIRGTSSNSTLTTYGNNSAGMTAISAGGAGGMGGSDAGGLGGSGGNGGRGGDGGYAFANNGYTADAYAPNIHSLISSPLTNGNSTLTTHGNNSAGIVVMSLGGNGGTGGSGGLSGGDGGNGGYGGNTFVNNGYADANEFSSTIRSQTAAPQGANPFIAGTSSITTYSNNSAGMIALSEGGAGGTGVSSGLASGNGGMGGGGGNAYALNGSPDQIYYGAPSPSTPRMTFGSSAITTYGNNSDGMTATSMGGDGGAGVSNGNRGSNGGDGGSNSNADFGAAVFNSIAASITTYGTNSVGMRATNYGGNGGTGGSGKNHNGDGGRGGDAGLVSALNAGSITVAGQNSDGIFALSQGGNGGNSGTNGGTLLGARGGTGGDGGTIQIYNTGLIEAGSSNSYGIYAASRGGLGGLSTTGSVRRVVANGVGGAGADVTVFTTGNVLARGTNSIGIYVESTSGDHTVPAGNLAVNIGTLFLPEIDSATTNRVEGGVNGIGVLFNGGAYNTLTNHGTLTTMDGVYGWAVAGLHSSNTTTTIDNYGTMIGSVYFDSGSNAFNNHIGAKFDAGAVIRLGAGNTFQNDGSLLLGGTSNIMVSILTGDFSQSTNGTLGFKLGGTNDYDQLHVSGSANLAGTLSAYQFNGYVPDVGEIYAPLTSTNLTGTCATFNDPYTNNYAIFLRQSYTSTNLYVTVMQDSILRTAGGTNLTHNQHALGRAADVILGSGNPLANPLITALDHIQQPDLPTALDLLAPEEFGLLFDASVGSANLFDDNLRQRMGQLRHGGVGGLSQNVLLFDPNRSFAANAPASMAATASDASGSKTPVPTLAPPQGWGFFTMGNAQVLDIGDELNAPGGDIKTAGITLGADAQVCDQLLMGVAFDYVNSDVDFDNNGKATIQGGKGSVFATWFDGNYHLDGAVGGGYNSYDTKRAGLADSNGVYMANGNTEGYEFDSMLSGGYDAKLGNFTLSPGASLYYTAISIDGFSEHGSLAPLTIDTIDSSSLQSRLGASLAYNTQVGDTLVKPEIGIYWQHEFMDVTHTIDASFANGIGGPFSVDSAAMGRDSMPVSLGVNVQWTPRVGMHVAYEQTLSGQNYREYNVSVGVDIGL